MRFTIEDMQRRTIKFRTDGENQVPGLRVTFSGMDFIITQVDHYEYPDGKESYTVFGQREFKTDGRRGPERVLWFDRAIARGVELFDFHAKEGE